MDRVHALKLEEMDMEDEIKTLEQRIIKKRAILNRLKQNLLSVRTQIHSNHTSLHDLSAVLQRDFDRMNYLPRWIWLLLAIHLFCICQAYADGMKMIFVLNLGAFLWQYRRLYRVNHGVATMYSLVVIGLTFAGKSQ